VSQMTDNSDDFGAGEPVYESGTVEMRVQQNLAAVRREIEKVAGDSAVPLLVILNDIAQPLAEEVSAVQDYYTAYSFANAYLAVVIRFIMPGLQRPRRERLLPLCEGLAEFLREFLLYNMSDREVLASRLSIIGRHVKQIADAVTDSAPTQKDILTGIGTNLQALNATMTASMTLLVGPFSVAAPASANVNQPTTAAAASQLVVTTAHQPAASSR